MQKGATMIGKLIRTNKLNLPTFPERLGYQEIVVNSLAPNPFRISESIFEVFFACVATTFRGEIKEDKIAVSDIQADVDNGYLQPFPANNWTKPS
jgi:hypothetical protein